MPRKYKHLAAQQAAFRPPPGPPRPGDWVEVRGMSGAGRLVSRDAQRGTVRVELGGNEWVIAEARVRVCAPPPVVKPAPGNPHVQVISRSSVRHEIDLHGKRVEEALEEVDRALDAAVVNDLQQLKIIHGHGTGRVRTAVRELLAHHPHVAQYRFGSPMEGGLACTVAELRRHR